MKKNRFYLLSILIIMLVLAPVTSVKAGPNWNNDACYGSGNPLTSGYKGYCTWYVWGRVREVTGIQLSSFTNEWVNSSASGGYADTPTTNSIAECSGNGRYHVIFIESCANGKISYSEDNYISLGNYHENTCNLGDFERIVKSESGTSTVKYIPLSKPTPPQPSGNEMTSGYDRTIPDGNYLIASAADNNYFLDIPGTKVPADTSSNVILCQKNQDEPEACDIWTVKYENGFYSIKQMGTNMSLDVYGGLKEEGTNIQVYPSNNSSSQKWAISINVKNGYRIQAKCSGFSVDVNGGTIATESNVQQWSSNDTNAQSWSFIPYRPSQPIENGRYVILSDMDTNMELDVAGDTADIKSPTNVQIWKDSCKSQFNSFDVKKLSNGYYSFINAASGKALDLYGGVRDYQANVCVYDVNGTSSQQWAIIKNGDGYALVARCSGLAMDVESAKCENGANVQQWPYNGQKNQIWKFVQAENIVSYDANGGNGAPASQEKYYKNDMVLSKTIPSREGYEFVGWSENKNATSAEYKPGNYYKIDKTVELHAVWNKLYIIKFETGESANDSTRTLIYGSVYGNLPQPQRTGYAFKGWFTSPFDGEPVTADTKCTGDAVVYAHWKKLNTGEIAEPKDPEPGTGESIEPTDPPSGKEDTDKPADPKDTSGESDNPADTKTDTKPDTKVQQSTENIHIPTIKLSSAKTKKGKKLLVKWKADASVDGYQIAYSTTKKFTAKTTKQKEEKNAKADSRTLKNLKKGKTYYVRIRAYKKVNGTVKYGEWSKAKKVKVRK